MSDHDKVPSKPLRISRRRFLGSAAVIGVPAITGVAAGKAAAGAAQAAILNSKRPDAGYGLNDAESTLYTVCLQCNTGCGIKAKLQNGEIVKIDGSPYNPWCMVPHLSMKVPLEEAARVDGALCPKGQAGVQVQYDPYRITKVLKRAGKRGENKWVSIPFDQAITEIVEGGTLFANVPGEESRKVEGLKSIMAVTDDKIAKDMEKDVKAILDEKDAAKKKGLVAAFKTKHAKNLDKLIDPNHPDLGPKNNQFGISWGRLKGGRSDFIRRFGAGFGTMNLHGHTTVCQGSLYFTCKAMSEQYDMGKFSGGQKFYWQSDLENARYVLFVGANLFEANYGPTNRTVRLTENLKTGFTQIGVVDPRFSKLASKAKTWLPIKPGEDGALAMAIIRWMLDNNKFDAKFLRGANKAAAKANGEASWTTATWLVEVKKDRAGKFVRGSDAGLIKAENRVLPDPKDAKKTVEYEEKFMIVMANGKPVAFDPNDEKTPVNGDLFVTAEIKVKDKMVKVKTGMQLLKESANEKSFDEWCTISGLALRDVLRVARDLTSHGKNAGVDVHRGPAQHTNGFYNIFGWMAINMLLGNFDWKGGMIKATTYSYDGSKGGPFDLSKVPGKITTFGTSIIRHELAYEKSTLFSGYPAKRNWYPLASDIYEELVPSIGDAYPYAMKALFLYMGTPVYALPAGHTNIEILADVNKLPLFFTSDIGVGTTSMYADYIFPDLSFLERWEMQGSHPNMPNKVQPVRQPVAKPVPEIVKVYGEETPISMESLLMALAEKLGLKAFGKDAIAKGVSFNRPEDFYVRAVANLAVGEKPGDDVPDANARELEIFTKSRAHLPAAVFDEAKWKAIAGDANWAKVVYVLNRGGRFEDHAKGYDGDMVKHKYGKLLCFYQEKTADTIHSGTGKHYPGIATYVPIRDYAGNDPAELRNGYNLHMITHRTVTMTKSRTIGNYWLLPIMPENGMLLNPQDAAKLGLKHGDKVKVVSATNQAGEWDFKNGTKKPMIGQVVVTEGIRPGVTSFALGYGHWATGAGDVTIDGKVIKGDPRRAAGVHANAAMWIDPTLKNTCMVDPVGGSVSFYDTSVKLEKVTG